MNNIFLILIILFGLLVSCLILVGSFFGESELNEAGDSPFECGFDPYFQSRIPYSIQFFTITIVFLIFDLEIILLMPLMMNNIASSFMEVLFISFLIFILLLGLIVEWFDKSLEWYY